jgi:ribosome-associated protein
MPENSADGRFERNVLVVNQSIRIALDEFRFTFSRSSGPGGQNVNKVNTKVRLSWPVLTSSALDDDVKSRFMMACRRRINADGNFMTSSQRYRDQRRNIDDCLEKLRQLIVAVATPPRKRKPTKPSRASKERRLARKRQRSVRKQQRRRVSSDD